MQELEPINHGDAFFKGLDKSVSKDLFVDYFCTMQQQKGVLHINNKIARFIETEQIKDRFLEAAAKDPVLTPSDATRRGCACTIS